MAEGGFNAHFVMKSWRGEEVVRTCETACANALGEFALNVEGAAKGELYKGHGVRTGTLRRSIHTSVYGYPWDSDNCKPSEDTPERGKQQNVGLKLQVGSGMDYALAVNQGWGEVEGYHYLDNGLAWAKKHWTEIMAKYRF